MSTKAAKTSHRVIFFCILTSVFCVLFSGCGGGGSSSTSTPTTTTTTGTITGTVSLPANTNAKLFDVPQPFYACLFSSPAHAAAITDLTTLTVKVGSATTNPNASGVYMLTVDAGTNLDLTVTTPSGNIVLEAIIPSVTAGAAASQNVDSTSTAVALIYKQNTSLTISQISSSSAVTNVKTAIETALTDSTVDSIATNATVTSAATTAVTPALKSITVSPSSVTVVSGATQTFTATGLDQFGSAISFTPTFSISSSDIGTITSSGVFTALKTGTGTITVTGGNNVSSTASITVPTGALNSLVISPTTVTLYKGDTQQFTVYGVDVNGNAKMEKFITVSSPTWSVTGSIGTIDANGLFTATAQGTEQVKAQTTKSDGTAVSITADVTVSNRNPSISGPTASSSSITTGSAATISVTASDPDSDTLSYSWSATGGTISGASSLVTYTAPSTAGTYTISVTVSDGNGGSAGGNVDITVTPADQYFPLGIGNRWEYDVSHAIGPFQDPVDIGVRKPVFTSITLTATGNVVRVVEGTNIINGVTTYSVKDNITKSWSTGVENFTNTYYYAWNDNQLLEYGYDSTQPVSSTTYSPPWKELVLPLSIGASWSNATGLGTKVFTIIAQENTTVPYGTLSAYKRQFNYPDIQVYADMKLYDWFSAQGFVKRDYFFDKLENWQVTDYDSDEPAAGDPCIAAGNCEDLNPGVEDTGTAAGNADIFDDKVELLGYFSDHEIYELKSYSPQAKKKGKGIASYGTTDTMNAVSNSQKSVSSIVLEGNCTVPQFLFYPNPLKSTKQLNIRYAVSPSNVGKAKMTVSAIDSPRVLFTDVSPHGRFKALPPSELSSGLYTVTFEASCADGTSTRTTKLLYVMK